MNKREVMLSLLDANGMPDYVPAAFFLHFGAEYHSGRAAVEKHLEYFRATGMDFVKIQYEKPYPRLDSIRQPADWANMPCYGADFYAEQVDVVRGIVREVKREALVVVTLYSPFMCAGHTVTHPVLTDHFNRDPEAVRRGLEIITDSLMGFVRACIDAGVDGFYHSTQGGEAGHFERKETFGRYIKPFDLVLMEEINRRCEFNILHVCDYARPYDDFSPFVEYPGDIVNCPLDVGDKKLTTRSAAELFRRPYMGGLERKGVLASGTTGQIRAHVEDVLRDAPDRFVLAADCTVPSDTPWANLKTAIDTAHSAL